MNIRELYEFAKKELYEEYEAIILLEEICGLKRSDVIINSEKEVVNQKDFINAINRRKKGEPLQYILGYWYFDGLKLMVKDGVLIPREDTLTLVESTCKYIKENMVGIDLCAGTGAVALSIANRFKNVNIEAIELYDIPYECLNHNIKLYGNGRVTPVRGDINVMDKNYENLDFIVSNPPYIKSDEIKTLQKEVLLEPFTALDGGDNGLDFYVNIVENWTKTLKNDAIMAFEIGDTQGEEVSNLMTEKGYKNVTIVKDFNNLDRVVYGFKS